MHMRTLATVSNQSSLHSPLGLRAACLSEGPRPSTLTDDMVVVERSGLRRANTVTLDANGPVGRSGCDVTRSTCPMHTRPEAPVVAPVRASLWTANVAASMVVFQCSGKVT